jgi:hypothetical protein
LAAALAGDAFVGLGAGFLVAFTGAAFAAGFALAPDFGFGAGFLACFLLVAIAADRPYGGNYTSFAAAGV